MGDNRIGTSETKDVVVEGMARLASLRRDDCPPWDDMSEAGREEFRADARASLNYLEKHFRERADQYLDEAFRYPLVWSANYIRSLRESSGKE